MKWAFCQKVYLDDTLQIPMPCHHFKTKQTYLNFTWNYRISKSVPKWPTCSESFEFYLAAQLQTLASWTTLQSLGQMENLWLAPILPNSIGKCHISTVDTCQTHALLHTCAKMSSNTSWVLLVNLIYPNNTRKTWGQPMNKQGLFQLGH